MRPDGAARMLADVDDFCDPELEGIFVAQVARGEFVSVQEAKADFLGSLDASIAEADAGLVEDIEVVAARLMERYANWPRAAE